MATTEKQADTKTKTASKDAEYKFDFRIVTNRNPRVTAELRRIGILLDAELKAEEEQARKAKA